MVKCFHHKSFYSWYLQAQYDYMKKCIKMPVVLNGQQNQILLYFYLFEDLLSIQFLINFYAVAISVLKNFLSPIQK